MPELSDNIIFEFTRILYPLSGSSSSTLIGDISIPEVLFKILLVDVQLINPTTRNNTNKYLEKFLVIVKF